MKPLLLALYLASASASMAADRIALVIGNNLYDARIPRDQMPNLENPINDARAVGKALGEAGFEVITVTDAGLEKIYEGLGELKRRGFGAKIGLVYYSGHGMAQEDQNYLIPVDARLETETQMRTQLVSLEAVLHELAAAKIQAKMVVLDCCRNDPFRERGWRRSRAERSDGLAEVKDAQLPEATLLMFSAAPGQKARDGSTGNSPFTEAFVREMRTPGINCMDAFFRVADSVRAVTGYQEPWIKFDGAGRTFRQFSFLSGAAPVEMAKLTPPPPRVTSPATPPPPRRDALAEASKVAPFVNSLGMEFVPLPGTKVLMCRTPTRVRDFRAYADDANYRQTGGAYVVKIEPDGKDYNWKLETSASWEQPGFSQAGDHPVVCVSWEEAREFCAWLTKKDGKTYRLPSDAEWSAGVGLGTYPWGSSWPPPQGAGNFAGGESKGGMPANWGVIAGYNDGYARTSPVGRFRENRLGLYDMGGNVWQWCEDEYRASMNEPDALKAYPALKDERSADGTHYRVLRGASWDDNAEIFLRSSYRNYVHPRNRSDVSGFRCVLVVSGG